MVGRGRPIEILIHIRNFDTHLNQISQSLILAEILTETLKGKLWQ